MLNLFSVKKNHNFVIAKFIVSLPPLQLSKQLIFDHSEHSIALFFQLPQQQLSS